MEYKEVAIIGHTGFIGSNIKEQCNLPMYLFNSKTIDTMKGMSFDLVISSANSSLRWKVNQDPDEDLKNIVEYVSILRTIKAKMFVLLSTIDVFGSELGVYEHHPMTTNSAYGDNRRFMELSTKIIFENYRILRLPIVYGNGFKKNVIWDLIHGNMLEKINPKNSIQLYNVKHIWDDIKCAIENEDKILNIATEPVNIEELVDFVFPDIDKTRLKSNHEFNYDMRTLTKDSGYFKDKKFILNELKEFVDEYKIKC